MGSESNKRKKNDKPIKMIGIKLDVEHTNDGKLMHHKRIKFFILLKFRSNRTKNLYVLFPFIFYNIYLLQAFKIGIFLLNIDITNYTTDKTKQNNTFI